MAIAMVKFAIATNLGSPAECLRIQHGEYFEAEEPGKGPGEVIVWH